MQMGRTKDGGQGVMATLSRNEVTVAEFTAAIEDNRGRVRKCLGQDWLWAEDEVVSDLTVRTLRRLDYWRRTNRTSLPAFVNQLVPTTVGEWFKRDRPKHRSGMTQTPERRAGRSLRPEDPDDAKAWEEYRRDEQRRADADVICDASDIFEGRDGRDGGVPAAAGDAESYRRWSMPDEDEDNRTSSRYRKDMQALVLAVQAEWGIDAWLRIRAKCLNSNKAEPILREISHWIRAHHEHRVKGFDQYPYLTACATRKQVIGPDRRKRE